MSQSRVACWTFTVLVGLSLLSGCSRESGAEPSDELLGESAKRATAIIAPLHDSRAVGVVTFIATEKGVRVVADIEGLSPGRHGFHVHEYGVCQADGVSAGAHFNPTKAKHGGPDRADRHAGDLGNLIADELGHAYHDRVDAQLTLSGARSIVGKSVIIHEKEDDYVTQPSGNAGGRKACGIIEKVE